MSAMRDLQQELLDESKQKLSTSEGKEGLQKEEIAEIANVIVAAIVGDAWTVMDEWGIGSLMDVNNPVLEDYRRSAMWNPARRDLKIRSRPDTPGQIDIFGRTVRGKGKGGFDLEKAGKVKPRAPSHAIKNAARWMQNGRFAERIRKEIRSFPFHKFFIVDMK